MGNTEDDPGAETQMFQAYVAGADRSTDFQSPRSRPSVGLIAVGAVVLCVVVLIILTLAT